MKKTCLLLTVFLLSFTYLRAQRITLFYPGATTGINMPPIPKDEVPILSVQFEAEITGLSPQPNTPNPPIFSRVTLTKDFDLSSIQLLKYFIENTDRNVAVISYYDAEYTLLKRVTLENPMITKYVSAAAQCEECPTVVESFTLNYSGITIQYGSGSSNTVHYDLPSRP